MRAGISLIETMIVVMITVAGLDAVFSSMTTSDRVRRLTEERNKAIEAMQSQVELLQAMTGSTIDGIFASSTTSTFDVTGLTPLDGQAKVGTIEKLSPAVGSYGCTIVRFTVAWKNNAGDQQVTSTYIHTDRVF